MDIAKADWLLRQTKILKRWKRQWVVLYRDGWLRYFDSPDDPKAEEALSVSRDSTDIKLGNQCSAASVPDTRTSGCLVEVCTWEDSLVFCTENPDDASAWYFALEEAVERRHPRNVQSELSYIRQFPDCDYGTQRVVYPDTTGNFVILTDDIGGRRRSPDASTGLLAGAAMGSFFMWPLMMWPLFLWH